MKKFRRFLFGTLPVLATMILMPFARAVTKEEFWAILEAEMDEPVEATAPYARPEFDDSAWETVVLPPAPDAPPPWPEGADGTIWYRRRFELPPEIPPCCERIFICLGEAEDKSRLHVNGSPANSFRGFAIPDPCQPPAFCFGPVELGCIHWFHGCLRRGTNVVAAAIPVRGGLGGIPSRDSSGMAMLLRELMHVTGDVCEAYVTGEWTIPLAGEWRYLFVPAAAEAPEGGAK